MNPLLARVSKRRNPKFYKVLSNECVYSLNVNDVSKVDYSPDHNLDEDSWFQITEFTQQTFSLSFLEKQYVDAEYNQLEKQFFSKISFLINITEEAYFFQKVTPSLLLHRKFLSFGDNATLEQPTNRIIIHDQPDAAYYPESDVLLFRSLSAVSSIFTGIDILYKEATDEETADFLREVFINVTGEYCAKKVGKQNRKRIALALNTLDQLLPQQRTDLFDYIHGYCGDIDFDSESKTFSVGHDNELKQLLYGIEQRFYTTPFSQERRLANSVQTL